MRLSRRYRDGAVPPTNVTYAYAISVCQKTSPPDLKGAERFLEWARSDGVEPSVFMYASAIWTAERSGNNEKALALFDEMRSIGCTPNSVAYDGVISALSYQGDLHVALDLYSDMKSNGILPTLTTVRVSVWISKGRFLPNPCY